MIAEVDKFYQENPAKLDLPVVAVILRALHQTLRPNGGEKMRRAAVIL